VAESSADYFSEQRRRRIPDLLDLRTGRAGELPVAWEALEAEHLADGEWPVVPMKWSSGRAGLRW